MFGRSRRQYRADVSLVSSWLGALMEARSGNGVPVPYDQLPITQGAGSLIADALSVMPLYAINARTGVAIAEPFPVLEQPNPEEARGDTVVKIAQSLYWTGNAGALTSPRVDDTVDAITVLNPNGLSHLPDPFDDLRIKSWLYNGREYERSAIVHWKLNDDPRRGPMGESPLKRCATALDTYGWAYRYLGDYFAQGGNPSMILRSKLELDPLKITELAEEWVSARQHRRPAFLPTWLDAEVPESTGELAAVIAVLEHAAAEVARALNLPVSLVNAPTSGYSLTYSNTNEEFRRWLAVSLGTSWIARLERGFSKLLPRGVEARLDPSPLYRADLFPDTTSSAPAPLAPVADPLELEPAS